MNSQDKPIAANDNLDQSLETSDAIQQEDEQSVDLWSEENEDEEIVTEFISVETAAKNEAEALEEIASFDNKAQTKPKKDISLDLDDWDFRNLPEQIPTESEPDMELDVDRESIASAQEIDDLVSEQSQGSEWAAEEPLTEINLNDSSDSEMDSLGLDELDDFRAVESLSGEPMAEISLDGLDGLDGLDEPVDNSADLELDSLGLDQLDDFGTVEAFDELGDNELDNLLDLDSADSLDSLIMEPTASLDKSFGSLDSKLNSSDLDLDLLLDDQLQSAPAPVIKPSISEPARAKSLAAPPAPSPVKAQAFDQTMRVSVRKLDNLNNLIGELVVKRNRLEDDQERLRRFLDNLLGHVQSLGEAGAKMHDLYERSLLEGALMASRQSRANVAVAVGASGLIEEEPQEQGLDALEMDRFNGFHLLSQDIIELIVRVREAASDIQFVVDETDKVAQTFRQVTSQLQDGMNSSRMVAFGQAADRLPRAIRDISRKQKKQTKLHVEGEDVLIDKMIVEHLYNPMTHLVNNAISHGIEKPEERLKKGKPEVGNIYIQAFIQGNQTVITVRDDGAGIDPEKVKAKAIEKNLITWAIAQNLSNQQVYELLFHPGFSTKDQADDFAGRGVGMDVVNTDLKKIRGSVSTESELGKGTTFTVRLPLVLSICKALTCVDNNSKISFPIDGVEDTKEYLPGDIQTNINGVRCISWKNTLLPLRPLSGLLNYNRQIRRTGIYNANQNNDDTVSVVILRSLDNLLAIEVDEIKTEQEIVIKQIDGPIAKPPGIAGATVLGDGTIMPIGDVLELIEIAQGKRTIEIGFDILAGEGDIKQAQIESVQQEPLVLVVDDSITVRELLSMSFNKLGYRVEQARDGQEAWDKLRGGLVCDMIFSDIEMPRMNGLELLSNLHQDSALKSIPVAMLTSRGADKHRQIANDLGAKAYLTKPYTEKDLMDVAQHLIEINRANKEAESATMNLNRVKSETDFKNAPLVLIIDDSVTVRELLSMSFKKAGYRVEQARDGQEAWEKLRDGLDCDLAFCDIEMPRMNGLELLSQLQKDEKLASLPIAMLTSRGAQKMRNIAGSRGANAYFVKPYVEEDLLKAAKRMINGEMLIEDSEGES
ncbi:MAG: hybrid sensor histidine kinase/response regulator [Waterburya sp.]